MDLTGGSTPDTLLQEIQKDYVLKPLELGEKKERDPYGKNRSSMKNHVFEPQFREEETIAKDKEGKEYKVPVDTEETYQWREAIAEIKRKEMQAISNLNDTEMASILTPVESKAEINSSVKRNIAKKLNNSNLPNHTLTNGKWAYRLVIKLLQNPELKESLKPLFKQISENLSQIEKDQILRLAVRQGHLSAVKEIIANGNYDLSSKDRNGLSPAHFAASANETEILSELKEAKANIDQYSNSKQTPLMSAARANAAAAVKQLTETTGVNVNERDANGRTALFYAASNKAYDAVKELLLAGADPNIGDILEYSPVHIAAEKGDAKMLELLAVDAVDMGAIPANLEKQDKLMFTPLMIASENGHKEAVEEILLSGGDLQAKNVLNQTALDLASNQEIKTILELAVDSSGRKNLMEDNNSSKILGESLRLISTYYEIPKEVKDRFIRLAAQSQQFKQINETNIENFKFNELPKDFNWDKFAKLKLDQLPANFPLSKVFLINLDNNQFRYNLLDKVDLNKMKAIDFQELRDNSNKEYRRENSHGIFSFGGTNNTNYHRFLLLRALGEALHTGDYSTAAHLILNGFINYDVKNGFYLGARKAGSFDAKDSGYAIYTNGLTGNYSPEIMDLINKSK